MRLMVRISIEFKLAKRSFSLEEYENATADSHDPAFGLHGARHA